MADLSCTHLRQVSAWPNFAAPAWLSHFGTLQGHNVLTRWLQPPYFWCISCRIYTNWSDNAFSTTLGRLCLKPLTVTNFPYPSWLTTIQSTMIPTLISVLLNVIERILKISEIQWILSWVANYANRLCPFRTRPFTDRRAFSQWMFSCGLNTTASESRKTLRSTKQCKTTCAAQDLLVLQLSVPRWLQQRMLVVQIWRGH